MDCTPENPCNQVGLCMRCFNRTATREVKAQRRHEVECSRCGQPFWAGRHGRPEDTEYTCHNCLISVVDLIDALGLPPFSTNGLIHAIHTGDLKAWMGRFGLNPVLLERWTGIDRGMWRAGMTDTSGLRGLTTAEVATAMRRTLAEAIPKFSEPSKGVNPQT